MRTIRTKSAPSLPPLAVVVMTAGLMWMTSAAIQTFHVVLPARLVSAVVLAAAGSLVCLAGVASFRRAKTTLNPMKPESASSLVVVGIYRYTRNPMYLGFLVILLAWAVFLSNLAALVWLPTFVVYINHFQIRPEERALASLFQTGYPAYQARVRRWI